MSKLLIDEYPLIVLPTLAAKIGLNEAIFLQQLNYWLGSSHHERDGKKWVYNTFEEWQKQLHFWPVVTIKRIVKSLREMGIVSTTSQYNKMPLDRTLWYTIDYDVLDRVISAIPSYQNDTMVVSKRYDAEYQNDTSNNQRLLPETTTEKGQELISEAPKEQRLVADKQQPARPPPLSKKKGIPEKPPAHPNTSPILEAFTTAKEKAEPGCVIVIPAECVAAKQLAEKGWTPEQVVECFDLIKADAWWRDKALHLATIAKQIGAKLKGKTNDGNTIDRWTPQPDAALLAMSQDEFESSLKRDFGISLSG